MCGRFDVDISNKEISRLLAELPPGSQPVKLGEVFPGNGALALILRDGAPAPEALAWGFPRWDGKGLIFNARCESALAKPLFRNSLLARPVAVAASGFYEWRQNPLLKRKERFRFTDPDGGLLYLAGFWNEFPGQEMPRRFTLLTTAANASMAPYHHRMPALLRAGELQAWLSGASRAEILAREPFALGVASG